MQKSLRRLLREYAHEARNVLNDEDIWLDDFMRDRIDSSLTDALDYLDFPEDIDDEDSLEERFQLELLDMRSAVQDSIEDDRGWA